MNLSNIKTAQFQSIDFQYSEEGYINVSKMCKPFNVVIRKLINRSSVQDYIKQLEIETGDSTLIHKVSGGDSKKQGIYTKPQVALYIASLLSEQMYEITKGFIKKYIKRAITSDINLPANNALTVTRSYTKEINGYTFQYRQDQYINLTKMCKQAGKELKSFLRQADTKAKLKALDDKVSNLHLPSSERIPLIQKRVGGTPTEQGTYGHPLVALFLAQWLSPEFAVAMVQLAQSYFKADVSLATDILNRATPEQLNQQGEQLANVLVQKADPKTEAHIQARLNTKNTNRELNKALAECPNVSRAVFSMAQDAIYKATYGKAIKTLKKEKGLVKKDDSIRDTLTTRELVHLAFCESLSTEVIDNTKPSGDINCSKSVYDTSKQVKEFAANLTHKNNN